MNPKVCEAIKTRSIVEFDYHGEKRIVEPHCHGISKKGNEILRGYQIGGGTVSGDPSNWRLFNIEDVINLKITDETFDGPRTDYNPNDKGMASICCRL